MRNQIKNWSTNTTTGDVQFPNAGKPLHEITNSKDIAEPLPSSNLHLQGACSIGVSAEGKKRKFQPFKELRKIFSKKEKKLTNALDDEAGTPTEEDVDHSVTNRSPTDKIAPEFLGSRMSASQEDIVGTGTRNLSGAFSSSTSSLSGFNHAYSGFAAELATKISRRKYAESIEDLGMSVSPGTSPGIEKSLDSNFKVALQSALPSTFSECSLPSMASSENDEDSGFGQTSRHSSKLSLTNDRRSADSVELLDLDTYHSVPLNHQAARHKLAVRPKKNHGISRHRRLQQLSSAALPSTPEVCEEGVKPLVCDESDSHRYPKGKSPPKTSSADSSPLSILTKSFSLRRAQTDHDSPVRSPGTHNTKVARSKSSVDRKVSHEVGRFNRRKHSDVETVGKGRSPSLCRDKKMVNAEKSGGESGHESFFYRLFNGRKSGKKKKAEDSIDTVGSTSDGVVGSPDNKGVSASVCSVQVAGSKDDLTGSAVVSNSENQASRSASPTPSGPHNALPVSRVLHDSSTTSLAQIESSVGKSGLNKPAAVKGSVPTTVPPKDRSPAPHPAQDRKSFGKKTAPPVPIPHSVRHSCGENVESKDLVGLVECNSASVKCTVPANDQGTGRADFAVPQVPCSDLVDDGIGQKSGSHKLVPLRKLSPIDAPSRISKIVGDDTTEYKPFTNVLVNLSFPKMDDPSVFSHPVSREGSSIDDDSLRDSLGSYLDSPTVTETDTSDVHIESTVATEVLAGAPRKVSVGTGGVDAVPPVPQPRHDLTETEVMPEGETPGPLTLTALGKSGVNAVVVEAPELGRPPRVHLSAGRMSPVANKEEESVMVVPNILSRCAGERDGDLQSPRQVSEVLDLVKSLSGRAGAIPTGRRSLAGLESSALFDSEVRVVTASQTNVAPDGVKVVSCPSVDTLDSRSSRTAMPGPQFSCNNVVIRLKSDNPVKYSNRHSVPCYLALDPSPVVLRQDKLGNRGRDVAVNGRQGSDPVTPDQIASERSVNKERCPSRSGEVEPLGCPPLSYPHSDSKSSDPEKPPSSSSGDSDDPDLNCFVRRERRTQGSRGRKSLSVNLDEGEPELFKVFAKRSLRRKGESDGGLSSECSSPTRMNEEMPEVECAPEVVSDGPSREEVPGPSNRDSFGSSIGVSVAGGVAAAEETNQTKIEAEGLSSSLGQSEKPDWWKLAQERKERRALREKSTFKSADEYLLDMARSPINRNSKVLDMVQTFQKLVS